MFFLKIFDLQENLIFVTDANQVVNMNKSALNFFGEASLFEFQKKYFYLK